MQSHELRELFVKCAEAWRIFVKAIQTIVQRLVEHVKRVVKEMAALYAPRQRYDLEHQRILMRDHQRAAAQTIRIQERKLRDRKPHWRAWKAQRI